MKRLAFLGKAEGLARQRLKSHGGSLRMCFSQDKTLPLPKIETRVKFQLTELIKIGQKVIQVTIDLNKKSAGDRFCYLRSDRQHIMTWL